MTARSGRGARAVVIFVLLAFVAAGCGSDLSDEEHMRAAGLFAEERLVAGGAGSTSAGGPAGDAGATGVDGAVGGLSSGPGGGAGSGSGTGSGGVSSGAADGATPGGVGGGGEIVLGSFGTMSGLVGQQVAAMPVAARAWAAAVNARGGIDGRRIRIVFGDDGGDPGQALALARRMVEQDKVVAFIAASAVLTMQSVTPYLEEVRVPVIGTSGGNLADDSAMVFHTLLAADLGAGRSSAVALATQSTARRVAIIYCAEAESCPNQASRVREYAPVVGFDVVYEAQVSIAAPDYTGQILQARSNGAEAVLVIMDFASIVRMIRTAHRQDWYPTFASTASVNEEAFIASGGQDVEGVLAVSNGSLPYSTAAPMQAYRAEVAQFVPGGAVGGTGAGAWVSAKLLEKVLAGITGEATSAAILEGLYSLEGETLGGITPPLTFPRGTHERVNLCSVPIKVENGVFVPSQGERFFCSDDGGIRAL